MLIILVKKFENLNSVRLIITCHNKAFCSLLLKVKDCMLHNKKRAFLKTFCYFQ